MIDRISLGRLGEDLAVKFLKKKSYKIISRNWRSKFGEIDIIAKFKGQFIFIEVKTKTDDQFGLPEEEFTFYKRKRLDRAIQGYFWQQKITTDNWRIDLVAIDFSEGDVKSRGVKPRGGPATLRGDHVPLRDEPEIRHYQGIYF